MSVDLPRSDARPNDEPAGPSSSPEVTETESSFSLIGRFRAGGPVSIVTVNRTPFTIGRKPENMLCLADRTVSSKHAVISERNAALYLHDLNSTNGTFLNGRRISGTQRLEDGDLLQFGNAVLRVTAESGDTTNATECHDVTDDALAIVQFGRLLKKRDIRPHLQPIVQIDTMKQVAFEVLARSRYVGLRNAASLFRAAAHLNAEITLSQMSRMAGMWAAGRLPPETKIFLNTHPSEINDPSLLESLLELRERWPEQPVVIEIHEAAVTDMPRLSALKSALLDLDMGLAFDDFGSGQARLRELVNVRPDYVKFDIGMIENTEAIEHAQQRVTQTLVRMTLDLGVVPLAEGVETQAQRDFCVNAGFVLGQGYYFGVPKPAKYWVRESEGRSDGSKDRRGRDVAASESRSTARSGAASPSSSGVLEAGRGPVASGSREQPGARTARGDETDA